MRTSKTYLPFFLLLLFYSNFSYSQSGCTDSQATNYNASATVNDGSCLYPDTDYTLETVGTLPDRNVECSGLSWIDSQLLAHNDGGNVPEIFVLDTLTGLINNTIRIAPGNWDWEDLAAGPDHLYIGDFGNNDGSRQNLRIYRIPKNQLILDTIWEVDTIRFAFQDQIDFTPDDLNTPYDCEAFFWHQDSLHVFTKDWVEGKTKHYVFSDQPGDYTPAPRDSFEIGGLVTGADISPDGVVALLGYGVEGSFLWLLYDYPEGQMFSGNKRKINIGSIVSLGQTEGIAFRRAGEGFISSEELFNFPAQLFRFSTWQWTDPIITSVLDVKNSFSVSPNPFSDFLQIEKTPGIPTDFCLLDSFGKRVAQISTTQSFLNWDLAELPAGFYFLMMRNDQKIVTRKVVKGE